MHNTYVLEFREQLTNSCLEYGDWLLVSSKMPSLCTKCWKFLSISDGVIVPHGIVTGGRRAATGAAGRSDKSASSGM